MTARVIQFPPRRLRDLILEWDGAWLVLGAARPWLAARRFAMTQAVTRSSPDGYPLTRSRARR
jgi:hypothetical protein